MSETPRNTTPDDANSSHLPKDSASSTGTHGATPELPALPEKPKSNGGKYAAIGAGVLALALAAGFGIKALSGGDDDDKGLTTVKVGTTEDGDPYWNQLKTVAKDKYGLKIEVTSFSDYTQANPALAQGQIDLNQFQHLQYLGDYNVKAKQDLTPIGSTYVVPLALYSKKHTALAQIPKGGKVAIPNDPTNQARALLLLQRAGLVTLKGGGNAYSTPVDIDAAKSKVTVTPVAAEQTAAALPSVDASVVNNNYAARAKLDPRKALAADDPKAKSSEPYINVIVARKDQADNPAYQKFVKAYHDPAVEKLITEQTKGTSVLVNKPAAELQSILSRVEAEARSDK